MIAAWAHRALVEAAREAFRQDFARWELPEQITAAARSLGIRRPSDAEVAQIAREAVPHVAV